MGSLEAAPRHRDPLPAIGFLGKDGSGYTPSQNITSPSSIFSPNIRYLIPTRRLAMRPPQPGYISPPESRRVEEEKDKTSRQSLPSIHEALGKDNHLPYPAPTSAPPPPQSGHAGHAGHSAPSHLIGRSSAEGPAGPPNPFGPASGSLMREPAYPHQNQHQADPSRNSLASINSQDSRNASLHSISTGKSPTQSAKTGITSVSGSQNSVYDYSAPPSAGSVASPNGYSHFPPNYSFPQPSGTSYPPPSYDNRQYMGAPRVDGVKGGYGARPMPGQPHSDSVKRHLDVYDVETSLNEISEMSTRTLEFSRHYAARAHQTQRSGPIMGSLPTLSEVEEMLHMQRRNQDALIRIRTAVVNQEQALAEMAQRKAYKPEDEHMAGTMYQEDFKGAGGFAGGDSKKRRGKAAPPGRCHSCNRAETPEWRRGPDGARTLCNACGLHYAKLTRKMGANKAATLGSNLKPKSVLDSASPTSH
ncbi:Zinc finger NHR/GATA-type [Penicillium malachiteum]|nr:Zinc finger NHR/GATA-type [Penicillium malachiteum]